MAPFTSVTIIWSPYHTGIKDYRVGEGPNRIKSRGIYQKLESLGVTLLENSISPVDDFEGEIGRSFEILARTSTAVSEAIAAASFPLILSGNCMASVGVACGVGLDELQYIYFDAHTDMHTPDTITHGYFDAMGLPILLGESFMAAAKQIPGFKKTNFADGRFLYCGLRVLEDVERDAVSRHGMNAIWGSTDTKVDFVGELKTRLGRRSFSPALVHLDLDVLDQSEGKVNGYESPGGLSKEELVTSMGMIPTMAAVTSLTVCSFNPNLGDGDKIADIGVQSVADFINAMVKTGQLVR